MWPDFFHGSPTASFEDESSLPVMPSLLLLNTGDKTKLLTTHSCTASSVVRAVPKISGPTSLPERATFNAVYVVQKSHRWHSFWKQSLLTSPREPVLYRYWSDRSRSLDWLVASEGHCRLRDRTRFQRFGLWVAHSSSYWQLLTLLSTFSSAVKQLASDPLIVSPCKKYNIHRFVSLCIDYVCIV